MNCISQNMITSTTSALFEESTGEGNWSAYIAGEMGCLLDCIPNARATLDTCNLCLVVYMHELLDCLSERVYLHQGDTHTRACMHALCADRHAHRHRHAIKHTDARTHRHTQTCWHITHTTHFFCFGKSSVDRPPHAHTHTYTRHTCRQTQHGERSVAGGRGRHLHLDNDTCCVQSAIGKEHSVHAFCVWSCTIMNCLIVKVNVCVCVKMHDSFTW